MATAEYTLNDAFEFDRVIMDFIRRGVYDIGEIDDALYAKGLQTFTPYD
ncbi:MAG: hypothetical protein IJ575_11800 [Selenomonadaceae bacterium]|nr:hypothetical protein [Selenomonadaceae bacterium]